MINEIMFNPVKDGYDYVELYNRSDHAVLLSGLLMANRNATSDIAAIKILTKDSALLQPKTYCVVTANARWLKLNYTIPDEALVVDMSSLPSFPDDEGWVVLLRKYDSAIIDEVGYKADWHFRLLSNVQGVALERIDFDYPSQDQNNWSSASSTSNYGTPGYENSQHAMNTSTGNRVSVFPKVFSPDSDGSGDVAFIEISAGESGKIANAIIYDVTGRRVRYLIQNALLGSQNRFKWDGYDDHLRLLPAGIYILFTQIFDMSGNNSKYRNCIVLDRKKI